MEGRAEKAKEAEEVKVAEEAKSRGQWAVGSL